MKISSRIAISADKRDRLGQIKNLAEHEKDNYDMGACTKIEVRGDNAIEVITYFRKTAILYLIFFVFLVFLFGFVVYLHDPSSPIIENFFWGPIVVILYLFGTIIAMSNKHDRIEKIIMRALE